MLGRTMRWLVLISSARRGWETGSEELDLILWEAAENGLHVWMD